MPKKLICSILFSSLPILASVIPLFPLKSNQQARVSIQVWVEGPPKNVMVSINGVGYILKSSPLMTPEDGEPPQPVDPIDPVHPPTPSPPIPPVPSPNKPPVGSIEWSAQNYLRAIPDAYDIVEAQIRSKKLTDHNVALQLMMDSRDDARRKFADLMTRDIAPLCDGAKIRESTKVADIWKSCAAAMRLSFAR